MSEENKENNIPDYDIDSLLKNAYEEQENNPYISCTFWGQPETGKTFTAMTFPGPVRFIDLDGGMLPNLKYFRDKEGKPTKEIQRVQCVSFKDDIVGQTDGEYDWKKVDPINTLKNFDVALSMFQQLEGGTIVIDTMTAYNDWLKMEMEARGPKKKTDAGVEYIDQIDWKFVNQKWAWAWEKIKNLKTNVVVVAREAPVYQGRDITDKVKPDLRANSEYNVSITAQFFKKIEQVDNKVITKRIATFSKFRGNRLGSTYNVEDCTYDKIIAILKEEEVI